MHMAPIYTHATVWICLFPLFHGNLSPYPIRCVLCPQGLGVWLQGRVLIIQCSGLECREVCILPCIYSFSGFANKVFCIYCYIIALLLRCMMMYHGLCFLFFYLFKELLFATPNLVCLPTIPIFLIIFYFNLV